MKKIAQGAEAVIYRKKDSVEKDRIQKHYRLHELDQQLRTSRTKREAKILQKLEALQFPAPRVMKTDKHKIEMAFVKGVVVKDILDTQYKKWCKEIGEKIALLHNHDIIHGDLTTSNMIIGDEVYFIDFGLSFVSTKIEDKAVDLHLFRQALESKHYTIWEKAFRDVLKGYKKATGYKDILQRFEKVEQRGRNKGKG